MVIITKIISDIKIIILTVIDDKMRLDVPWAFGNKDNVIEFLPHTRVYYY